MSSSSWSKILLTQVTIFCISDTIRWRITYEQNYFRSVTRQNLRHDCHHSANNTITHCELAMQYVAEDHGQHHIMGINPEALKWGVDRQRYWSVSEVFGPSSVMSLGNGLMPKWQQTLTQTISDSLVVTKSNEHILGTPSLTQKTQVSIPAWINNHMPSKVLDDITNPFPNVNGCTI